MRDPLLGPVAAIASGILAARFVPFRTHELMLIIAAFLALGILAMVRRARVLAGICCLLGLVAGGALTALAHRPGPAPQLDVTGREVVILSGCVVNRPLFPASANDSCWNWSRTPASRSPSTPNRARFCHPLPTAATSNSMPACVPRNYENPGAFDYRHYLARRDIFIGPPPGPHAPCACYPAVAKNYASPACPGGARGQIHPRGHSCPLWCSFAPGERTSMSALKFLQAG